ncbi:hypothetical protein [Stenotrophomonas sp. SAU14A_NAIMI4_8]|uniref:hypothetical protein n=1 Tax=Stenotrophomonas sp. SAU14A_NAIMI4_8 TaxID=2072409 RepID=UPI00131F2B21|nr:hypothetical protein [Stenotrophomonas sp. SAU14A_NAIMI4_8]
MSIPLLSNGLGTLIAVLAMPRLVHDRLAGYKLSLFLTNVDEGDTLLGGEVWKM